MTNTTTPQRPEDVVSPITDGALPNKVSAEEARQAGRFVYDKPKSPYDNFHEIVAELEAEHQERIRQQNEKKPWSG